MKRHSGERKLRTESTIAVLVGIAVLLFALGLPGSAAARGAGLSRTSDTGWNVYMVWPNGHNDTADIQAAFNACTGASSWCTVELVPGVYHVAQITVYGFDGSFLGAGQGVTIIKGLPNLPPPAAAFNTSTSPFWAGLPGPSNPWPELFTFVNGTFRISGMTITDTYLNPVMDWNYLGTTFTALWASILITGGQANVDIDHLTLVGGTGDYAGFNNANSILFGGQLLPAGWTDPFAQIPISGSISVTHSVFRNLETAVDVLSLVNATATVCFNTATFSEDPWEFWDLSYSTALLCDNQASNIPEGAGAWVAQSFFAPSQPSTVYIIGNSFRDVNSGSAGIFLIDTGPLYYGVPPTLSAVVSGNVIQTNTSCGCYLADTPAIGFGELASFVASGNTIVGGGVGIGVIGGPGSIWGNTIRGAIEGIGLGCPGGVTCIVYPDVAATGIHVTGNFIKNSGQFGIAVQNGSSNNTVAYNHIRLSGVDDIYWDGTGTDNEWSHNYCKTSSPPGLC